MIELTAEVLTGWANFILSSAKILAKDQWNTFLFTASVDIFSVYSSKLTSNVSVRLILELILQEVVGK